MHIVTNKNVLFNLDYFVDLPKRRLQAVHIPSECDEEVRDNVSLVLGKRATLWQLVGGVQGLVQQVRRVVGVLEELRVVGQ